MNTDEMSLSFLAYLLNGNGKTELTGWKRSARLRFHLAITAPDKSKRDRFMALYRESFAIAVILYREIDYRRFGELVPSCD